MKDGLRVFYTNADQLANKLGELEARIKIEKPHLILITEVNKKNAKYTTETVIFHMKGYQFFHTNVGEKGRGVAIYVQENIKDVLEITPKTKFSENKIVAINISKTSNLLIACIYRSESGSTINNENLLKLLKEIEEMKFTHKLVIGDFNYKHIDWENWQTSKSDTSDEQCFINCIQDIYWFQHVCAPTRFREGSTPSTLDLILTNEENMIQQLQYESPLGKSDHSILNFKFMIESNIKFQPRTIYKYDHGDYASMIKDLTLDWENEFNQCGGDINQKWEKLKSKIKTSTNNHIPSYQTKEDDYLRKGKIPLSTEIRKEIRKKHRHWTRAYETKAKCKQVRWKKQRNKVSRLIKEAEIKFETDVANEAKTNPKKLWKYIKSKTKVKSGIAPLLNRKTKKLTVNDQEKAEVLAAQFASVMVKEDDGETPELPNRTLLTPPLSSILVTEEMVLEKLKKLDASKSPGPDDIHPRVLKETAPAITPALTKLFNESLKNHTIPDDWKTGIITSIFKKGDKSDPGNYRPVSLTCIICKILESIIFDFIIKHLRKNKLISKSQYGFISRRSASLQLLTVMETWCNILDDNGTVDDINMDFKKAFDSVPHRRLVEKIRSHGIIGDVLLWLKEFLSNRKQKVNVNGSSSEWCDIISGVPQGSVIAALLFVIFINDLPEKLKSYIFMFADDLKFFHQILDISDTEIMQEDLNLLNEWSKKWLLSFHPDKCVTLRITLKKDSEKQTYYLGDHALKNVDEVKDLGILVDSKLQFNNHLSSKVNKANQMWGMIRRAFKHMNEDIFRKLFCSLVRPHLEYSIQFWAPYLRKNINQIESVQRRATKCIPGYRNLSYEDRLKKLKLPSLAYRRLRGSMIEVYKILNVYDPEVTPQLKMLESTTRGHNQRIYVDTAKKVHPKHHSFHLRIAKPWNSLPQEVVSSPNLNTFKNRLDKHWRNLSIKYNHLARDFER